MYLQSKPFIDWAVCPALRFYILHVIFHTILCIMASYPLGLSHTCYHCIHSASQKLRSSMTIHEIQRVFWVMYKLEIQCSNLRLFCLDCVVSGLFEQKRGPCSFVPCSHCQDCTPTHNFLFFDVSLFLSSFPPSLPFPSPLPLSLFSHPFFHLHLPPSSPVPLLLSLFFFFPFPLLPSFSSLSLPFPLSLLSFPPPFSSLTLFYFLSLNFVIWTEVCGSCPNYTSLSSLVLLFQTYRPFLTQHIN